MSYLTRPITWPTWKFGVLKICVVTLGILIGAHFADFWQAWDLPLLVVSGVTFILSTVWGVQSLVATGHGSNTH